MNCRRGILVLIGLACGCASQQHAPESKDELKSFQTSLMVETSDSIERKIAALDRRVDDLKRERKSAADSPGSEPKLASFDAELQMLGQHRQALVGRSLELLMNSPNF